MMPDSQSTPEKMLEYWKGLSGDDSPTEWETENMGMFFQTFRPHGDGFGVAFKGVVGAEGILPRLMQVYQVTAEGWERDGVSDGYFVVRHPLPLTAERARELGAEYLQKVLEMANQLERKRPSELAAEPRALLDPLPAIKVVQGEAPPLDAVGDTPEGLIYEIRSGFMEALKPVESHADLLDEALYTLAGDYSLGHHILWPLYRDATPVTEPFAAYFELWKHGAECRFHGGGVTVHVPNLAG